MYRSFNSSNPLESLITHSMAENRNTKLTERLTVASASLALATIVLGASLSATAFAATKDHVLVIDEGVDLVHFELKNRAHINSKEFNGRANTDDDRNGFVDDVSGWNLISNDSAYFPLHVREVFVKNDATVEKLLGLYNRIEEGDREAIEYVYGNPDIASAMSYVLSKSHGTHVAGIIVKYGNQNAIISSANVFTPSSAEASTPSEDPSAALAMTRTMMKSSGAEIYVEGLETLLASQPLRASEIIANEGASTAATSVFDDTDGIRAYVNDSAQKDRAEKQLMSRYLKTTGARVVNLSLGFAKVTWKMRLDAIWDEYLEKNNLPESTPMTATQRANYNKLLSIYSNSEANWNSFFSNNPQTLFVVAAGNDGDMQVPNAGNNAINEVAPANCAGSNSNVITVAATTPEGVIADFSNYNSRLVNIGAWGVAVPSTAPNHHHVKMSGTSMASPYVAGVASAMFSANSRLTASQAKSILINTASPKASLQGKVSSNGMVNPAAAVSAARGLGNGLALADIASPSADSRILPGFALLPEFTRTLDTTLRGEIHATSELVKSFLR